MSMTPRVASSAVGADSPVLREQRRGWRRKERTATQAEEE